MSFEATTTHLKWGQNGLSTLVDGHDGIKNVAFACSCIQGVDICRRLQARGLARITLSPPPHNPYGTRMASESRPYATRMYEPATITRQLYSSMNLLLLKPLKRSYSQETTMTKTLIFFSILALVLFTTQRGDFISTQGGGARGAINAVGVPHAPLFCDGGGVGAINERLDP